mmetsp:Transcript_40416/g.67444  ORF Transcript_40416/g.67444 Transcript_40416/m.67444 type:complete len:324 (-) Transcript_40416:3752-4723(-)
MPPRTSRGSSTRASARQPSCGSTASMTSSCTKGSALPSCCSIHHSDRCCSGRRGYFLKCGGWALWGSQRLLVSCSTGRSWACSAWSVTRHEKRTRPAPCSSRGTAKSALCTREATFSATCTCPLAPSRRIATAKGCGRCLRACSYAPACLLSSRGSSLPLPALTHRRLGGDGAHRSHRPVCSAGISPDTHVLSGSGMPSRCVTHASASNVALDRVRFSCRHAPSGHTRSTVASGNSAFRTATADAQASRVRGTRSGDLGTATVASSAGRMAMPRSCTGHHRPVMRHVTAWGLSPPGRHAFSRRATSPRISPNARRRWLWENTK